MTVVRPATLDDADVIGEIHVEGWQSSYADLLPRDYLARLDVAERQAMWREALCAPTDRGRTFVAEATAAVAGFISTCPSRDPHTVENAGEVSALYLRHGHKRQGVGTALLRAGMRDLTERGFSWVTLLVLEGNAGARAFYEHAGFAYDGGRVHARIGGRDVVELRYTVPLPV